MSKTEKKTIVFLLKISSNDKSYKTHVQPIEADNMKELRDFIKSVYESSYTLKFMGTSRNYKLRCKYEGLIEDLYVNDWYFDKHLDRDNVRIFNCHLNDPLQENKINK